jgi:O-antigen/teichoic acid export membrane protein
MKYFPLSRSAESAVVAWAGERMFYLCSALGSQLAFMWALGKTSYGEFSYILNIAALLLPLCHFGVAGLVSSILLSERRDERGVLGSAMFCRLIGWSISIFAGVLYLWILPHSAEQKLLALLLCITQVAVVFQVLEYPFQIDRDPAQLIKLRLSVNIVFLILKVFAAVTDQEVPALVILSGLELIAIGFCYTLGYWQRNGVIIRPRPDKHFHRLIRRAPALLCSSLIAVFYLKIGLVLLQFLSNPLEVGNYAAALRISESWYPFAVLIVAAFFPSVWSVKDSPSQERKRSQLLLDGLVMFSVAAILVVTLIGVVLFELILEGEYSGAFSVLLIQGLVGVFVGLRAYVSQWLINQDEIALSVYSHAVGALTYLAIGFVLIPSYGAIGAAVSALLAHAGASWLIFAAFGRTRRLFHQVTSAILVLGRTRLFARRIRRVIRARR